MGSNLLICAHSGLKGAERLKEKQYHFNRSLVMRQYYAISALVVTRGTVGAARDLVEHSAAKGAQFSFEHQFHCTI